MAPTYNPPYSTTSEMLAQVAEIAEQVGRLSAIHSEVAVLRRQRGNRTRAIHATLAIEGNRLSPNQVTAILDGQRVLASPREVQEVRNALLAYERFTGWTQQREQDLLEAHRTLMVGRRARPLSSRRRGRDGR